MEIPTVNPAELELNPLGLIPAEIIMDTETVLSLDQLFRNISETRDLNKGALIEDSLWDKITLNGVLFEDCRVLYMEKDCAVFEYGEDMKNGTLNIAAVRQDPVEIVRAVQLLPELPIPGSINASDIVKKFRNADDVLRNTEIIVENA